MSNGVKTRILMFLDACSNPFTLTPPRYIPFSYTLTITRMSLVLTHKVDARRGYSRKAGVTRTCKYLLVASGTLHLSGAVATIIRTYLNIATQ